MIPKIIHQIWIGPKTIPIKYMKTWKSMNPEWEHMIWTDDLIKEHYPNGFINQKHIDEIEEWAGKADIMRYEILHDFGGFYADADSICVGSLDDFFLKHDSFAGFENEQVRQGLIANGYIGAIKGCELMKILIDKLFRIESVSQKNTGKMAWQMVGPLFFTNTIIEKNYPIAVYPSYLFIPEHYSGIKYTGKNKIYAKQLWGSTKEIANPDYYNQLSEERNPKLSIVIPIYKIDDINWFRECIQSIDNQTFKDFEVIIIDDGSPQESVKSFLIELSVRPNFKIVNLPENLGIGPALNEGIKIAKSDLIVRMDADDIMVPTRLEKQYKYMIENPEVDLLGAGIQYISKDSSGNWIITQQGAIHPENITKEIAKSSFWYINHPTVIYRKSVIDELGGYNDLKGLPEDYELWTRMVKSNKILKNLQEVLIGYRLSPNQFTSKNGEEKLEFLRKTQSTI